MSKLKRIILGLVVAGSAVGLLAAAAGGSPAPLPDIGRGERLAIVVGGSFASRAQAEMSVSRWGAGEIEGFYLVRSEDFEGLLPGRWLLVSAFRTMRGAREFEDLAAAAGFDATTRLVARYLGTTYIGLGQEPHPDGSGPLRAPLPVGHPDRLV